MTEEKTQNPKDAVTANSGCVPNSTFS